VRRTSRLVLLLGIFLAALTFVVVLFLQGPNNGTGGPGNQPVATAPVNATVVVANADIPLGTVITQDVVDTLLATRTIPVPSIETNALGDVSQSIGKTTRTAILTGQQVHSTDFQNRSVQITVPTGKRAFPVQVNELTGVLNLLDVGDTVDLMISLRGDAFPVVQVLTDGSVTVVSGINPLSIKLPLLLQDVQIIGVLDAPAPAPAEGQAAQPAPSTKPAITGANKLLVLAVTPQQAEVLLFARTTGTLDAILRPPSDAGQTVDTTGVILKTLVDDYGILPPEIVQVPIPTPLKK
jgi:Flp pilus assembly protein CpaB